MPFPRPTLEQLRDEAQTQIAARLPGADARLPRSNLEVLARVHAGGVHGLYGYLDYLSRQIFADTADSEHLSRIASIWSVERKPAGRAAGAVLFTGIEGLGIPIRTVVQRPDGEAYLTTEEALIVSGQAVVAVSADTPGAAANAAAGTALRTVSPIAGIDARATVAEPGLAGGADQETDDSLRARLLARLRRPPHGGAGFDYVAWALEVPGITRAWVGPGEQGPGTVILRVVADGDPDPIPTPAKLEEVKDYIDQRRPVTADLYVLAPVPVALNFTIRLLPDSLPVRGRVEAELHDLVIRESAPGATLRVATMRQAIAVASSGTDTDSELLSPLQNVEYLPGHMAVFGQIVWA